MDVDEESGPAAADTGGYGGLALILCLFLHIHDNFSGNSVVPRSLSTLLAQVGSMLTIRVHIFASRPSDDCSDVPVGSF